MDGIDAVDSLPWIQQTILSLVSFLETQKNGVLIRLLCKKSQQGYCQYENELKTPKAILYVLR